MYQVIKVLNNNGIIAEKNDVEYIFLGKGIGFHHKAGECFESLDEAKVYRLEDKQNNKDPMSALNNVDPLFIDISNAIILEAEKKFGTIDTKILLPLADHIEFSLERQKNNVVISNPFSGEIKALFEEEYQVAIKAKDIIKEYTGVDIKDEEIGYITLHIHSALTEENVTNSMSVVIWVKQMIEDIEDKYQVRLNKDSLSYNRLMTHIKYMITRVLKGEDLKVDMSLYVKNEFPESFEVAKELCKKLSKEVSKEFSEVEVGYLAIHIERVRMMN
ncbi:beta-glucoside bgl operon antiterminator, BglG family [Lachnospiraceae bacterium KM106-2]|nr:beta-glucoside bgl operon antiterminator, BglG family [Lachnospiraceae bacterium KM106-2]